MEIPVVFERVKPSKLTYSVQFALLCLVIASLATVVSASERVRPRLKYFRVHTQQDLFVVTATLFPAFQEDIESVILTGQPTTFEFDVFLKETRWYWDNRILSREKYLHTVVYDTLRKVYSVEITRGSGNVTVMKTETDSWQKMQEFMTQFRGELSYPESELSRRGQYYVSLSATLTTRQLPSPWNRLLFFLSSDFRTETSRKFFPEH